MLKIYEEINIKMPHLYTKSICWYKCFILFLYDSCDECEIERVMFNRENK